MQLFPEQQWGGGGEPVAAGLQREAVGRGSWWWAGRQEAALPPADSVALRGRRMSSHVGGMGCGNWDIRPLLKECAIPALGRPGEHLAQRQGLSVQRQGGNQGWGFQEEGLAVHGHPDVTEPLLVQGLCRPAGVWSDHLAKTCRQQSMLLVLHFFP